MHRIIASAAVNMIDIRLSGLLTLEDVTGIGIRLKQLFSEETLKPGYLILGDIAECSIQSREIMNEFSAMVARMPKARRIAIISGSALVNMQLGRVMSQPYLRVVADRQVALAWLVRGVEPAIAA